MFTPKVKTSIARLSKKTKPQKDQTSKKPQGQNYQTQIPKAKSINFLLIMNLQVYFQSLIFYSGNSSKLKLKLSSKYFLRFKFTSKFTCKIVFTRTQKAL